ncbi:regulatory protein amda-related protein, partial [Colletotrichum sojae]
NSGKVFDVPRAVGDPRRLLQPLSNALCPKIGPPMEGQPGKPHVCSFCNRGFRKPEHLQRHTRIHTKEKPFSCDCGLSFSRKDLLKRHKRLHHTGDEDSTGRSSGSTGNIDGPSAELLPKPTEGASHSLVQASLTDQPTNEVERTGTVSRSEDSLLGQTLPVPPEYRHIGRHHPQR